MAPGNEATIMKRSRSLLRGGFPVRSSNCRSCFVALVLAGLVAGGIWSWCVRAFAGPADQLVGELRRFEGHTDLARCLAVSRDGRLVLSGGHDKTLRLWDLNSGKQIWQTTAHRDIVRGVALPPDGKRALSSGQDGLVYLWDATNGKAIRPPIRFTTPATSVAFSPDGKQCLVGLDNNLLSLWDLDNWK